MANLLEALGEARDQNHREAMAMAMVAHMIKTNDEQIHTKRRMDAQVDALLKSKCPDNYEPPEAADMGHTFLNSPIIGDDALSKIAKALAKSESTSTAQAQAAPQASQPAIPTVGGMLWGLLKKMLPLLLVASLTYGAVRYFTPEDTDTTNEFTIEAEQWTPPTQ